VLINITGGSDMTLFEVNEASMLIQEAAHEDANIIFGAVIDDEVPEGEVRVTVIATGIDNVQSRQPAPPRERITRPENPFGADQLEIEDVKHMRNEAAGETAAAARGGQTRSQADEMARSGLDFASPFEEERDAAPAFIRRTGDGEDEDREVPAFLRRAQD
jgi:cell division protein FtsZ